MKKLHFFLSLITAIQSTQVSFQQESIYSSSLVTHLASYPQYYSHLVQLLQRALLVPTLNRLQNATFFAPTNKAIKQFIGGLDDEAKLEFSGWDLETYWEWELDSDLQRTEELKPPKRDNRQVKLREQILYHLINETYENISPPIPPPSTEPDPSITSVPSTTPRFLPIHRNVLLDTLYFPSEPSPNPGDAPDPPPISSLPLGGQPQVVTVKVLSSAKEPLSIRIGRDGDIGNFVDWKEGELPDGRKGKGSAGWARVGNGVIIGVEGVLMKPRDIGNCICAHQLLTYG
jgi:solute carrier family 25 (mitochondrial carnitine/acylcarnitine transporter), member 20/29